MADSYKKLQDILSTNSANVLLELQTKIEEILKIISKDQKYNNLVQQFKNIIKGMSKLQETLNANHKQLHFIADDIKELKDTNKSIDEKCSQLLKATGGRTSSTIAYKNGKYTGQLLNDLPDGKGTLLKNDGTRYEGDFKTGFQEGKGLLLRTNGDKYEGDYVNDKIEGRGVYTWKDGSKYEGDFKNNNRDGKGIYFNKNGDRYEGDWKEGKFHGQGIYYFSNGDREVGNYKEGKAVGVFARLTKDGKVSQRNYPN